MMIAASGTLAAIAQAFGKKSKAMAAFRNALGGSAAAAGDSSNMSRLRKRIHGLIAKGAA